MYKQLDTSFVLLVFDAKGALRSARGGGAITAAKGRVVKAGAEVRDVYNLALASNASGELLSTTCRPCTLVATEGLVIMIAMICLLSLEEEQLDFYAETLSGRRILDGWLEELLWRAVCQ